MTFLQRTVKVGVVGSLILGLIACAPPGEAAISRHEASPREAREFQNEVLLELARFVPRDDLLNVPETGALESMGALSCRLDGGLVSRGTDAGFVLPGAYDLWLVSDSDPGAVIAAVQRSYAERPGWRTITMGSGENLVLQLSDSQGYVFFLEFFRVSHEGVRFSISSFSPCLPEPDGFDRFARY